MLDEANDYNEGEYDYNTYGENEYDDDDEGFIEIMKPMVSSSSSSSSTATTSNGYGIGIGNQKPNTSSISNRSIGTLSQCYQYIFPQSNQNSSSNGK